MYGLALTTAPSELPVSLSEARNRCDLRPNSTDHNVELDSYIRAAAESLGAHLNRQFGVASYRFSRHTWQMPLYLPRAPLVTVEQVTYLDSGGVRQTWNSGSYQVITDREPGYLIPVAGQQWPEALNRPDSIQVDYTCGSDYVPDRFRVMLLYLVRQLFEMKAPVSAANMTEVPLTLRTLIYNASLGDGFKCY